MTCKGSISQTIHWLCPHREFFRRFWKKITWQDKQSSVCLDSGTPITSKEKCLLIDQAFFYYAFYRVYILLALMVVNTINRFHKKNSRYKRNPSLHPKSHLKKYLPVSVKPSTRPRQFTKKDDAISPSYSWILHD